MKTFSEQIKVEGLFEYTCRMMREKRYSLPQAGGTWYPPVKSPAKRSPIIKPEVVSYGKPIPITPIKLIVPMSVDSVDEQDSELEAYLEPNPQELEVSAPLAHEEVEDVMFAAAEQEEGDGQLDIVVSTDAD